MFRKCSRKKPSSAALSDSSLNSTSSLIDGERLLHGFENCADLGGEQALEVVIGDRHVEAVLGYRAHNLVSLCGTKVGADQGLFQFGDGAGIPRENMRGGLSETPAGRRQHCRVRYRLGRLLVGVTYESGAK